MDVVFILDSSGSVTKQKFLKILNFIREIASRLDVDSGNARVGMITFSDKVYPRFTLGDYSRSSDVESVISDTQYMFGTTNAAGKYPIG